MKALDKKLFRDLWHLRGQVITVALVVASGIATYVSMHGSYRSLESALDDYYAAYRFADVFAQVKRAPEFLAQRISAIPGVAAVQSRVVVEVTLDVPNLPEPAIGRLISIPEQRPPALNGLCIRRGRYIQPGAREEAIASEAFAAANQLEVGDTIGAVINGRWDRLRIVGIALSPEYVYEIRASDLFPDNKRFGVFWVGRETLSYSFDMKGAFNDVSLALAPGASQSEVIARLDSLLEPYGGLGAYGRGEQISARFLADELTQDKVTGIFIPIVFLSIAAFLINGVLSRLVRTQKSQVGLLKAFGYGNFSVGFHYLEFALTAVFLGALIGTPAGFWLGSSMARMYQNFFRLPELRFIPSVSQVLVSVFISAGAACLGALMSVRSAVSLPPAEAMRPEGPTHFRAGLAERLGLNRVFPLSTRMIMRNLERKPWNAVLSVVGIACAVAILVVGFYFFDAINYIYQVEFQEASREDATIVLHEPHGSAASYDLKHLPGVILIEPFRAVPVRLRFGHRSRRVGILGLSKQTDLRRLVDRNLNIVVLPPEGLVLSTKLAEILGVSSGDTIEVEVLEGRRPKERIVVQGLLDGLLGISAYMDLHSLNRMMQEGGTISGGYLQVDSRAAPGLYATLKRTPGVGGITIREAMLASFQSTIEENISISTSLLIVFAAIIAVGIVYNSARIALSERGHELASLRVLGFRQQEIGIMLLGEQGLLTAVSLPVGLALGYAICALLTRVMETELYRLPLVLSGRTYSISVLVVIVASFFSGLVILRILRRMDLVSVLKARE
jgi:putative ABC transport system permease protein